MSDTPGFALGPEARVALKGVTVVDLTRYLPGPYCTRILADLGASIVKVESPPGDPMRGVAWYDLLNHGKDIVSLDLREASGRDELHALLARADVCVEGFKPATARAIGVDGATLSARYPALVHCSISGYGQHGAAAQRAAHDINYQADAGLLTHDPRVPALLAADITAALHAAIAILAALVRSPVGQRVSTATGATLDISLFDAARAWAPFLPPPILRGEYACYNVYETADRQALALGALEPKFWERFCRRAGRPDWISRQFAADPDQRTLLGEVRALFLEHPLQHWERELATVDCCFSAITNP